jgi:hypothetical protein
LSPLKLLIVEALAVVTVLIRGLDTGHHTHESAKVNVRTIVQLVEDLVRVFLDLVLDVHLSTRLVLLFPAQNDRDELG